MKDDLTGMEQKLRSLKWRTPSADFLQESLQATLAARASAGKPSSPRVRPFIPRALRWPLAACWLASLLFWWLTPREQTSPMLAITPSQHRIDPADLIAQRKSTEQLTHELLLALEDHGSHYR